MCIFTTKKMGVTLYWFDELLVFYSSHIVEIVFFILYESSYRDGKNAKWEEKL